MNQINGQNNAVGAGEGIDDIKHPTRSGVFARMYPKDPAISTQQAE